MLLEGHVAQEALYGMDADRLIGLQAITGLFAGVVTDAPMDRRHRVVGDEGLPGFFVALFLHQRQPSLDIFPSGAGMVTGWQGILIDRALAADGAGAEGGAQIRWQRHITLVFAHHIASLSVVVQGKRQP
ncbi:Uncharacterised protein [Edwardsiella tarda]|nr:Uncharacterised protein [Edwardsiella tarda]